MKIGFLGAGRMATALAGAFVRTGLVPADRIAASDPSSGARASFTEAVLGARAMDDNIVVAGQSDVLFVAVKPQVVPDALATARPAIGRETLVISIAAGVPLAKVARYLQDGVRTVRAMPNTPCLVGQSATAYALGSHATAEDGRTAAELFGAVGLAFPVDEELLDAVTGLSGSGPAFVYTVIEALTDGGVQMGLPHELAAQLAAQTVRGAAEMVLATGAQPAALRDQVTSPGGTTAAGLAALERAGLPAILVAAVEQATRRSQELGKSQ